jgi:hypothetical protein
MMLVEHCHSPLLTCADIEAAEAVEAAQLQRLMRLQLQVRVIHPLSLSL